MDGREHGLSSAAEALDAGARLAALGRLAAAAGAERVAAEAKALQERVAEGRFYVACVGQFKRGKSSLINALIGEPLLPVGVIPVTSVVTVIRHGPVRRARTRRRGGDWQDIALDALSAYVAEAENPENAKHVEGVEVLIPAPLLASGLCLVDTPGLGSVSPGNTDATRAFVPHLDAALVVLGADPPISGEEAALVAAIGRQVRDVLVVLNKADRLTDAERREARAFNERELAARLGRPVGPLREVSATERLAGVGPPRDFPALVDALERLAHDDGSALVRAAAGRGLDRLSARLRHALEEERAALERPLAESEQRLTALRACVAAAERSRGDLGALFTAEETRLAREFSRGTEAFLTRARPQARARLARALDDLAPRRAPALRRRAIDAAQALAGGLVDAWLPEAQAAAEALYAEGMARFVALANDFLARLTASGGPGLDGMPRTLGPEAGFRVRSRLFYTFLWGLTSQNPLAWVWGALRPRRAARRVVEREVGEYLERILTTNATRAENDFKERVLESRRRLQAEVHELLGDVVAVAERALAQARARRAAGSAAVQAELERLEALRGEIDGLVGRQEEATRP